MIIGLKTGFSYLFGHELQQSTAVFYFKPLQMVLAAARIPIQVAVVVHPKNPSC